MAHQPGEAVVLELLPVRSAHPAFPVPHVERRSDQRPKVDDRDVPVLRPILKGLPVERVEVLGLGAPHVRFVEDGEYLADLREGVLDEPHRVELLALDEAPVHREIVHRALPPGEGLIARRGSPEPHPPVNEALENLMRDVTAARGVRLASLDVLEHVLMMPPLRAIPCRLPVAMAPEHRCLDRRLFRERSLYAQTAP